MAWPKGKSRKGNAGEHSAGPEVASADVAPTVPPVVPVEPPVEPDPAPEAPQTLKEANETMARQNLQEVLTVPAVRVPVVRLWSVEIPHNPRLQVEAPDREAAIQEYFRQRNIVSTTHLVDVREIV